MKEVRRTLHELHVHQVELEMQNQELRRAHEELEVARERWAYFVVARQFRISGSRRNCSPGPKALLCRHAKFESS
ncbi:MAG: hypothetical protein WCO56_04025 [Verrucomicrobiota bacterium]